MSGLLAKLLAVFGLRSSVLDGWWPVLVLAVGGVVLFVGVAWLLGKITSTDPYESPGTMIVRACLGFLYVGGALIFIAALLWAWSYLFG